MFNSLKKWVQDKAVDFTPPSLPSQPSPSSPSFYTSNSSTKSNSTANHYYYQSTSSFDQPQYNERLSSNPSTASRSLSRPISMDSVRSSKTTNLSVIPPPPASPGELDLSHLNLEEQKHIANVLRRARAVDEQQTPTSPVVISSKQSPPASLSPSTSLASTASSSSSTLSTSTSSFQTEKPEIYDQNDKNDNNDDNEICQTEELPTIALPELTLPNINRCQVCNKEQQEGNLTICLRCQDDEEIARIMQDNTIPPLTAIDKSSSSPQPNESNNHKEDKFHDNVMKIDQELIRTSPPIQGSSTHINPISIEKMNDNQGQKEKQLRQSPSIPPLTSTLIKTRSNNLTEIDEDDFFYQEPSPYVTTVDQTLPIESVDLSQSIEDAIVPSYKIDEFIDEDDTDERDHVKELEETIANISRYFPLTNQQEQEFELKTNDTNLIQPTDLSIDKIDIDSILEMEIESPSTDENIHQLSTSVPTTSVTSSHPLHIPITIPIMTTNRRGSLSRSSGVRENLTDLLVTTDVSQQETRSLQRTSSIQRGRDTFLHRQKRNLPTVPAMTDRLQLRRANSESRFSLPAVPPPIIIPNSNIDDESDLLEIDLNDPTGSMKRTERSKTESEITNSNDMNSYTMVFHSSNQSPSISELARANKQTKQLRDQTTNTPPISNLNSSIKTKKKLKKKLSTPSTNINGHHSVSTNTNGQISPTQTDQSEVVLSAPPNSSSRPRLQKSTSTEISYPFPVSKLILSRDSLNPSRQDGTDLGLRITGGHSIPNCMEVTACIEHIDTNHRNYPILQNAVQEGDEVLEVGGVSLRGKSALFVHNLMNSIEDEFEIVVRSQHVIPPNSPPIQIHKPKKPHSNTHLQTNLTPSYLMVDSNTQRRHSMDTYQASPTTTTTTTTSTVVKSQSTIMPLPNEDSSKVSETMLSPTPDRKKSVSSKERLFSVESLHRTASTKSNDRLIKVATQSNDTSNSPDTPTAKRDEQKPTTTFTLTTPENRTHSEDPSRRRIYEHRNSLLPNDPGLNGIGSAHSIERRSSNESDESDNLSQYFRSPSSRKSSLMATNDLINNSHERSQSITVHDNDLTNDASRRLQNFLKNDEKRLSNDSAGRGSITSSKREGRKSSSTLGSFKFIKKKTKSVDLSNQPIDTRDNLYVGDIQLQIGHDSEREQLVVRIIQAKNLPAKDANGYSDPFVKVYLLPGRDQENKRRTKHISKNLNPNWDHMVIYGNMHREELQYKMLEFTVWDYDRFKANDFIGQVTIDLKDTNVIDDKAHWYRLQASRSREEATNRGSSPRLFKMTSSDSTANSTLTLNKNSVNMQSPVNQRK